MPNVLIRDVPSDELERIRAEAAAQGVSLQSYLRDALRAQAHFLDRQEALAHAAERLRGRGDVPEGERDAVLDAIDTANATRADELGNRASS